MTRGGTSRTRARFRRFAAMAAITPLLGGLVSLTGAGTASAAGSAYSASFIAAGTESYAIATDPATYTIYAASLNADELSVINGATGTTTTTISLGAAASEPAGAEPLGIAVDSATDTVYVAEFAGNNSNVVVIGGATNTVTTTIKLPAGEPVGVAVDSSTSTVYVAEPTAAELTVIDTATNTVTGTISTGTGTRPADVAVDESANVLWVTNESGTVIAINGSTQAVISSISLGASEPIYLALDPASSTVYAADFKNGDVAVIDTATDTLTTTIPTPGVYGVAVDSTTDTVYADGYGAPFGTTWVIGGGSNTVRDTLGRGGTTVTVDPKTGAAYEAAYIRAKGAWAITPAATNSWSPILRSGGPFTFNAGQTDSFSLLANGLPAPTFNETGTLPAGLNLSPDGTLSGTPAPDTGGLYPITLTASNGVAPAATQKVDVVVDQPTVITSPDFAAFRVGTLSTVTLTSTGYPGPAGFSASDAPAWISIENTTQGWLLGGTPPVGAGGVYKFTLDAIFGSVVDTQPFTLTVDEAPGFSAPRATFGASARNSYSLLAHGFPVPTVTETGRLPYGIKLSSSGVLSGLAGRHSGGVYRVAVSASNGIGPVSTEAFTLTVLQFPDFLSAPRATFRAGRHRSFTMRTSAYPVAKLSESGHLPRGVRFHARSNGTAVLTGDPVRADRGRTYILFITARGIGDPVRQEFRLKIS